MAVPVYIREFYAGLQPDPYIDLVEWANTYRYLPKESSVEPGRYRTGRVPYVEEILRELSPQSSTQEVVVIKPTQTGFTEVGNCFLFAIAHIYQGPAMMVFPTTEMAQKHSKKKIAPSVRVMSCLDGIIKKPKSRDAGNTLLLKEFPGGSWTFTGSNSPASARSDSIRFLLIDDFDGFKREVGDEGAPGDLFKRRTDAFGIKKKIYLNSTPTKKGDSPIEAEFEESSQGHYMVPCPHCGKKQFLEWGGEGFKHGLKFRRKKSQVVEVWYVCIECHQRIEEWQKTEMLKAGEYVHKYPDREKRGFKINSLYSPMGWLSWRQIAKEFLSAKAKMKKGDSSLMKTWVNTRLAETFEEEGQQPEWVVLQARAEPYKILTIPKSAMLLVAGVDTQDNRLEVVIQAFGPYEECWIIYQGTIYGDPDLPDVWRNLDMLLMQSFKHETGVDLHIRSMAVDSGGHKTQAVYNYCRTRSPVVFAVKGASAEGKAILNRPSKQDIDFLGRTIKAGVELYPIGTDVAKTQIYERLSLVNPGPGYYHFPIGLDEEFYRQLTAEKREKRYVKGFVKWDWVKTRERNDVLDCFVYALAAAYKAGLASMPWADLTPENFQMEPAFLPVDQDKKQRPKRPKARRGAGRYSRPAWLDR